MVAKIRTLDFLPEIFKTTPNESFLSATLDQLVQQPDLDRIQGYIGRKFEYGINPASYYVTEEDNIRTNYQLEPAVVFKKPDTNIPYDFITYPEIIDALQTEEAPYKNNSNLFENQFYTWDNFTDLDKLTNFSQYYWIPNGPNAVTVEPDVVNLTSNFAITSEANYYNFSRDNLAIEDANPTIELVRGGTYQFFVDQKTNFWIQSMPGTSGVDPKRNNASTRQVFGVLNNGEDNGQVIFNVPYANAQDTNVYTNSVTIDLVSTKTLSEINGKRLSEVSNIDGVRYLEDKIIMFYGPDNTGTFQLNDFYDNTGFDFSYSYDQSETVKVSDYFFKIIFADPTVTGDPVLLLEKQDLIPTNYNINILEGLEFTNSIFVRNPFGEITKVDPNTAALDILYYQDSENPLKFGIIKLIDTSSTAAINVETDILGKTKYFSPNNVTFTNGLKVNFAGRVIPESYRNRDFYVEGVGTSIQLLPVTNYVTPEPFTEGEYLAYDFAPFDIGNYSEILYQPVLQDYITINRASRSNNAWSRSNRWFHLQVVQESIKHTNSPSMQAILNNPAYRARRPIIEFTPNLKLFNSGTEHKEPVDFIDFVATDALTTVAGQTSYFPDGDVYGLFDGARIIFAADESLSVRNKVFVASFVSVTGSSTPVIVLQEAPNGDVTYSDQIVIVQGVTYRGKSYYFDGSNWIESQQKTLINQPPLFDVFDTNGISFGDKTYYSSSTFEGSSIFTYKLGTGANDPVLQLPIVYSSVSSVGDIVFEMSYNTDEFNYVVNGNPVTKMINLGYPYIYENRDDYTRQLSWVTAAGPSFQYQAFNFEYQAGSLPIFKCDIPAYDQANFVWPVVRVYLSDNILTKDDFSYTTDERSTTVTFNTTPIANIPVQVLIYSEKVSLTGYYTIPNNLENNPYNEEVTDVTLGDIRNHFQTVCVNSNQVTGNVFGANNYRDLPTIIQYGNKIIQNSAPVTLAGGLLRNKNYNLIDSLNYSSSEYTKYKALIVDLVTKTDYSIFQKSADILDDVLNQITAYKADNNPFFWSDMLPSRSVFTTNTYKFGTFVDTTNFQLSRIYDFSNANYYGVLVYISREIEGVIYTDQLIKGVDYTISDTEPKLTVLKDLIEDDTITVKEYYQTYGSYIPNTPTKLGFYSSFIPKIVYDEYYVNPDYFILGHDGSLTRLYGEYKDNRLSDFRDRVLFEFECRIYNNLKASNTFPITQDDIIPGYFRKTEFNYDETLRLYSINFLNWVGKNRIDYKSQYFDKTNSYTYNYYQSTNRLDNKIVPRGNWRGLYNYFFDTSTPNLTPWEMLGYTDKPTWWDVRYGQSPYTIDNDFLWTDIENGYDYNGGNPRTIESRKRPGVKSILPVDSMGNLVDPLNSVIGNFDSLTFNHDWKTGDWGPAEYSYLKSSTYPFDLIKLISLCKPAQFYALGQNLDTYKYSDEFQQYLVDDKFRFSYNTLVKYGTGTAQHSYFDWIVDYIQSSGTNGANTLNDIFSNLDIRLIYRLAGFSDKNLLKFYIDKGTPNSKNTSLLIPDESYSVVLHNNQPFDTIIYSSVIIQKVTNGYRVFGNSQNKIYFKTYAPLINGSYNTLSVGNVKVVLSKDSSKTEVIVPYNTEFSSPQTLAEFLNNYGKYLVDQGLIFDDFTQGILVDWNAVISEVLYWTQSGWEDGAILNVNPAAKKLYIDKEFSIVEPLTIQQQNFILNQNLTPIQIKDLSIVRNGTEFTAIPLNENDSISYFNGNLSNIEHAIIFDNTTLFNDLIYDPKTGLRQYRILLKGLKTNEWTGTMDTKGFILNQDNIQEWKPYTKYTKGVIVKYKSFFYAANTIILASDTFQQSSWVRVDYEKIQKGMLPNASTRAFESTLYYDTNEANLENDSNLLAFSLIGYRPRDYLAAANLDDISQVSLYKTIVVEKGTKLAASAIQNIELQTGGIQYETYENWAINIGQYGGLLGQNFIEFKLDQQFLNSASTIVAIVKDEEIQDADYQIPLNKLTNYGVAPNNDNILPTLASDSLDKFPSAGYVNGNDVAATSYTFNALLTNGFNPSGLYKNEYVWIADHKNDWEVFAVAPLGNTINPILLINVINNLNNTCTLIFSSAHNLAKDDLISIAYYDERVDGFYVVQRVNDLNSVTINLTLTISTTNIPATITAIIAKYTSQRVAEPKDITTIDLLPQEFVKETIWVDNDTDGGWSVYRKNINYYPVTGFTKPNITSTFGSSVVISDTYGYFVGDSGAGKVYHYSFIPDGTFVLEDEKNVGAAYGTAMALSDNILVVTRPGATSFVYVYELVLTEKIYEWVLQQTITISSKVAGAKVALSGDKKYMYVTSPANRQFLTYRLNSDLTYTSTGFTVFADRAFGSTSFALSGDRRTLFSIGDRIAFANTSGTNLYRYLSATYSVATNRTTINFEGYLLTAVAAGAVVYKATNSYTYVGLYTQAGLVSADNFGSTISTNYDGSKVFVSAPNKDYGGTMADAGNAYVYDRITEIIKYNYITRPTQFTVLTLSWTPTNSVEITLNGSVLTSPSQYTLSTNTLTIKVDMTAGDMLEISSGDFVNTQTIIGGTTVTTPRVGMLFGKGLDATQTGSELAIGVPFDIDDPNKEGAVYRFTNYGKRYGIIKGNSTYTLNAQTNILINNYAVTLPGTGLANDVDAINDAVVPNVQASYADGKISISLIDFTLDPTTDKLNLTVFNSSVLTSLGITTYNYTQLIHDPNTQNATQFGNSIKFNEYDSFVVSAPRSIRYTPTTFDFTDDEDYTNDTVFDNNFTLFIDTLVNAGTCYVYDYLPAYNETQDNTGKFVFGQTLNDFTNDIGRVPYFGDNIAFSNYKVLLGSPNYLTGSINGRLTVFSNITNTRNWTIYRRSADVIDVEKLRAIQFYDNQTNLTIAAVDYIDPLQGKILGAARQNLDFIGSTDPAGYNSDLVTRVVWGTGFKGTTWLDTSRLKFLNYHQDDNVYNLQNWGTVFPGSDVAVYTWIESDVEPVNYTGSGIVYDFTKYTTVTVVSSSGTIVPKYYYWVRNTGQVASDTKTLADNILESYIANPFNSGISFFAPLARNVFGLYNCENYIRGSMSSLHIGFKTSTNDDPAHHEFKLIRDGYADDFLTGLPTLYNPVASPEGLYQRLLDSFAGVDSKGQSVPDPFLPPLLQSGVQVRPKQSFFLNRFKALENYCQYVNNVMIQFPIVEMKNPSFLSLGGGALTGADAPAFFTTSGPFYDTSDYWEYVNWWQEGYNNNTRTDIEVPKYYDLEKLTPYENMIAGVVANSNGKREVYRYINGAWERIGLENGTIQIKDILWDYELTGIGFGDSFFDSDEDSPTFPRLFDYFPSEETYYIIRGINEEIFTESMAIHRNQALILMFEYIVAESEESGNYLPWLNKTSFLDVQHTLRELVESRNFQRDNEDFLFGYMNEVKPYHVKLKEFSLRYTKTDLYDGDISDFDLPAQWSEENNTFITPELVFDPKSLNYNQFTTDATIWQDPAYNQWYQNYGLSLTGIPDYPIGKVSIYVPTFAKEIYVDNAFGFPVVGLIKINNEFIGYTTIDRDRGILSGLSRGLNDSLVVDHNPDTTIYIDLNGAEVMTTGRGYTEPPVITVVIDTNIYPAPTKVAVLKAQMSGDRVIGVQVVDPGNGYKVNPDIVVESSIEAEFTQKEVNFLFSTVSVPIEAFETGDLVQYNVPEGQKSILGLAKSGWYFVRLMEYGTGPKPFFVEEGTITPIAFYKTKIDALLDTNKVEFYSNTFVFTNKLSLSARIIPVTTNKPTRLISPKLKFDRTSYNPIVTEWQSNYYYVKEYLSLGNDASDSRQLADAVEFYDLAPDDVSIGCLGTGATFNVFNWIFGNKNAPPAFISSGENLGVYTASINTDGQDYAVNDVITIYGTQTNGTNPSNNVTITVTGINFQGGITAFTVAGVAPVVYNASLQGAVIPITAVATESGTNDVILTLNYTGSTLTPGYLIKKPIYIYKTTYLTSPYTYNDIIKGGIIKIYSPRIYGLKVTNEYFIDIENYGTSYVTGDTITISGALLGGATPANDLIITITFALGGQIIFYSLSGVTPKRYDLYYANPISDTQVKLYTAPNLYFPIKNTLSNPFIFTTGDTVFYPEPLITLATSASLVAYNNKLYKCIESNSDEEFDYNKWELLGSDFAGINALDRIITYYQPSVNMPGRDLAQLMTGLEYPNSTYRANRFTETTSLDVTVIDPKFYPNSINITSIIYNNGKYVAIGNLDESSVILYSTNLDNWTFKTVSDSNSFLTDITYSDGYYIISSLNEDNPLLISADALSFNGVGVETSWDTVPFDDGGFDVITTTALADSFYSVASYNGVYVAVGNKAVYSDNATNWQQTFSFNSQLTNIIKDVAWVELSYTGFIAVGYGESTQGDEDTPWPNIIPSARILTSYDGAEWVITDATMNVRLNTVFASNSLVIVAGENSEIWYSVNANNWNQAIITGISVDTTLNHGLYALNTYVIVGDNGSVLYSSDGANWQRIAPISTNNLRRIIFDGTYFVVVGDNATILRSRNIVDWEDVSFVETDVPFYTIKGDSFLSGYGPEEMVPAVVTDNIDLIVHTTPGSLWLASGFEHTGFNVISQFVEVTENKFSFDGIVINPMQLMVYIVDSSDERAIRIFEESSVAIPTSVTKIENIDWVNKEVTLNTSLTGTESVYISVFELGGGNQIVRGTSDNYPVQTNTNLNVSFINTNTQYTTNYLEGVIFVNGVQQVVNVDFTLVPNETDILCIQFASLLDTTTNFISFAVLGSTVVPNYNSTQFSYSIPLTQVFQYVSGPANFTLTNRMDGDNVANAIVYKNGERLIPSTDYSILGDTLTVTASLSANDVVAVSSYNDTATQSLVTESFNTIQVTPIQSVDTTGIAARIITTINPNLVDKDFVTLDGFIGAQGVNDNSYYVKDIGSYVEGAVTYYPFELYFDIDLGVPVTGEVFNDYQSSGYVWLQPSTLQINQPSFDLFDEERLFVTVNGTLVTNDKLRLVAGNYLNVMTEIALGDEVLITSMVPSASPNETTTNILIDEKGNAKVYNSNFKNRTWLIRPLSETDDTIYVNDVANLVDTVSGTYTVTEDNRGPYFDVPYNIKDIKQVSVYNVSALFEIAQFNIQVTSENSVTRIRLVAQANAEDIVTIQIRFGDTVLINAEQIRFKRIDYDANTITGIFRGSNGTSVKPVHENYSKVYSLSPKDELNDFYYDKTWNSEEYTANGDPLQISDTIPANFLNSQ